MEDFRNRREICSPSKNIDIIFYIYIHPYILRTKWKIGSLYKIFGQCTERPRKIGQFLDCKGQFTFIILDIYYCLIESVALWCDHRCKMFTLSKRRVSIKLKSNTCTAYEKHVRAGADRTKRVCHSYNLGCVYIIKVESVPRTWLLWQVFIIIIIIIIIKVYLQSVKLQKQ